MRDYTHPALRNLGSPRDGTSNARRRRLEGTATFGPITRTQAVGGLQCAFELRSAPGSFGGGVLFALTLGTIPDCAYDDYLLTANVSAPGRQSCTYRVRTSGTERHGPNGADARAPIATPARGLRRMG